MQTIQFHELKPFFGSQKPLSWSRNFITTFTRISYWTLFWSLGREYSCWSTPAQSYFRVPSEPMTIFLCFFTGLVRVLKWDLLFNKRRGLTATGHSPCTGEWLPALALSSSPYYSRMYILSPFLFPYPGNRSQFRSSPNPSDSVPGFPRAWQQLAVIYMIFLLSFCRKELPNISSEKRILVLILDVRFW
jgi:hypothetical protein